MRNKIFEKLGNWSYHYTWRVIFIIIIVTIVSIIISSKLEITTSWSDLLPDEHPKVKEYDRILKQYDSASNIIVVVQGKKERIKAFAREVAPHIEEMDSVKFVNYKIEEDFFKNHALMLMKTKSLKNSKDVFTNPRLIPLITNINESMEKEYVYSEDEDVLSTREETDNAIMFLEGIERWLNTMENYTKGNYEKQTAKEAVDKFLIGDTYYLSYDENTLLMFVQPNFSVVNTDACVFVSNKIDAIIDDVQKKYPDVDAGITGFIVIARDEMETVSGDMFLTSILAFVLIIALFIVSFRMWISPVLAGITLIVGIIFASAFASLVFGYLNIMTSMFMVVLIGLGVDFSIHIISVFTENRSSGMSIKDSILTTLRKSGSGIVTGAVTTSVAFLTLLVSDNRGMYEFGVIAGAGVIFCMISSIVFLPAMLVVREKRLEKKGKTAGVMKIQSFNFLGKTAEYFSRKKWIALTIGLILTIALLYQALNLKFDYDMLNIEAKGLKSVALNDTIVSAFDMSPDYAMVTTDNFDSARTIVERAKKFSNISRIESITEYLPSDEDQKEKAKIIRNIRKELMKNRYIKNIENEDFPKLLNQLDRLWMNITELSTLAYMQGQIRLENKCFKLVADPEKEKPNDYIKNLMAFFDNNKNQTIEGLNKFQNDYQDYLYSQIMRMANPSKITIDDIPEHIVNRYRSNDGKHYLITIYPKKNVWNLENLETFNKQIDFISPRGTGTPPMFLAVINMVSKDGKRAASLTVVVIFLILLFDFRRIRMALVALIPLVLGAIWMAGLNHTFGLMINVVNIMGIPLIFGIGIDDGVHIIHRYRIEGHGKIKLIFSSTGKAIMLTTITTMLAFGSLAFSAYRGFISMGIMLSIGVGACFITTVLVIAPLIKLTGNKKK